VSLEGLSRISQDERLTLELMDWKAWFPNFASLTYLSYISDCSRTSKFDPRIFTPLTCHRWKSGVFIGRLA